ncbi:MAG: hypothetical protein FGM61_06530 [Sediminibacterium sp.]|nr:hypothetical protein [Sediminibacterium sp.]
MSGNQYVDLDDLVKKLGKSKRTLQRTIEIMHEEKKAIIERKPGKRSLYIIYDDDPAGNSTFTEKECEQILTQLDSLEAISDSLKKKLSKTVYLQTENVGIYRKEINTIQSAISNHHKILIEKYKGRDKPPEKRIITPVSISISGKKIDAMDKGKIKTFNIENMEKVKELDEPGESASNLIIKKDVFGFSPKENEREIHIKLLLTQFAYSQLTRQFPIMEKYIFDKKGNVEYPKLLEITVYDIQPIGRFITGLFDRVKILGDAYAKMKLKEYYLNHVEAGYHVNFK